MRSTMYTFQSYPATSHAIFTCAKCGKPKRSRTFKADCTVNPFNVKADGSPRNAREVAAQSREKAERERDEFIREPWCASCEDALSLADRQSLRERRRAVPINPEAT